MKKLLSLALCLALLLSLCLLGCRKEPTDAKRFVGKVGNDHGSDQGFVACGCKDGRIILYSVL